MITNDNDDDDLPARHRAIIKWLVSDFYREWSLKKIIINFKKFWQMWIELIIQPGTSINFLSGFICSILCISVTFFFLLFQNKTFC